jgi:hypothetical protein
MRAVLAAILLVLSAANVPAQQVPRADKEPENRSGRTIIPEKIGTPLKRGLISSDVRLGASDDRLGLPSAPHSRPRPRAK